MSRRAVRQYRLVESLVETVAAGESPVLQKKEIPAGMFDKAVAGIHRIVKRLTATDGTLVASLEQCEAAQAETLRLRTEMEEVRSKAESTRCQGLLSAAQTLNEVIGGVRGESGRVGEASARARTGAQEQQKCIGEAATAMEQMNASVSETASSAHAASEAAEKAMGRARTGADIVAQTLESIRTASGSSRELTDRVARLGRQAEGIGRIMGVISDIADQTNLLALNAAIEAARAGDAGRGFAVVADEVRKLAEKTMEATRDVGVEIQTIQSEVERTVKGVEHMADVADSAALQAEASGSALEDIVAHAGESADRIREIATAASQQSAASEAITRTITEVNAISESTGGQMRDSDAAVSVLGERLDDLSALVEAFELVGNGRVQEVLEDIIGAPGFVDLERGYMESVLKAAVRKHAFLELLYVTDAKGRQVVSNIGGEVMEYSEDRGAHGSDWAGRPWFDGAVESGTYYVSDVYVSSASGGKCITVSTPVRDSRGVSLGVLAADVRLES
ncbi:methyl-accepting chemotaxis protein [Salidesulfovibrio onnuriiensis]|uniref:methyl-accepting chemotaxis protein n=1 Tax=Salidesulfovibrio onnuriiensis TaxID=2583823 RepID=UPI00202B433E|nr:methyl-accepting chemotaxis protein [Salidesulfovibrio onnuriiensis]